MSLGRSTSPSPTSIRPQWRNNGVCEQVILSASTIVATNSHKQQDNTKKKMEWIDLQKVLSEDTLHRQQYHDHYRHHHHQLQNHQKEDRKGKFCKKYSLDWLIITIIMIVAKNGATPSKSTGILRKNQ